MGRLELIEASPSQGERKRPSLRQLAERLGVSVSTTKYACALHAQGRGPAIADHGRRVAHQNEIHERVDHRGDGTGVDTHHVFPIAFNTRGLQGPSIGESKGDSMHRSALKSDPGNGRSF